MVYGVYFFSKVDSNRFFITSKKHKSKYLYKWSKIDKTELTKLFVHFFF